MAIGSVILNPSDPGLYRAARGVRGDSPAMVPDGQRVAITTGESKLPPIAQTGAAALDPHAPGFALLVLAVVLLVFNGRFAGGFQLGASAGVGKGK